MIPKYRFSSRLFVVLLWFALPALAEEHADWPKGHYLPPESGDIIGQVHTVEARVDDEQLRGLLVDPDGRVIALATVPEEETEVPVEEEGDGLYDDPGIRDDFLDAQEIRAGSAGRVHQATQGGVATEPAGDAGAW